MSQAQVCTNCGSSEIDIDHSRGDAVCTRCGSVLEDNLIVSEVTFAENSIGGTSVIGQFVSSEGNKSGLGLGSGFRHGLGRESRQITLDNGKKRIQSVGNQLQLNSHCIETAYNFFKLAVNKRLTRGRRTNLVVAACLYLVCRTERTPHLLLDFSDVLQTDVFLLGRAYLRLAHELCINVPAIDPCLYIPRFAHKLEFGEKEHEVSMTAVRLVCRMKRDWIHHGRRPSGLCGAAVLVAARLHGFNRTIKEVVKVVRMSSTTIRKRLYEFGNTPSGQLTLDEFQNIDLEEEQDPPCFTLGRKKAKQQHQDLLNNDMAEEVEELQRKIDRMIDDAIQLKEKRSKYNRVTKDTNDSSDSMIGVDSPGILNTSDELLIPQSADGGASSQPGVELGAVPAQELMPPPSTNGVIQPPSQQEHVESEKGDGNDASKPEDEDLDLSGLDDDELDMFLLDDKEVEVKTKVWMEENKEFLEKQREKDEREAKEKEKEGTKEKRKYKKHKKKNQEPASTAGEAIEKMLVEKKISSKINYDVLRDLNKETTVASEPQPAATASDPDVVFTRPAAQSVVTGIKRSSVMTPRLSNVSKKRKFGAEAVNASPQATTSQTSKPVEEPPPVLAALDTTPSLQQDKAVVVECGPVEYAHEAAAHEEDYDEDEDDEDISTALLMMHGYGGDEDYGEYDDEL